MASAPVQMGAEHSPALLRLPAELRNRIYRNVLVEEQPIQVGYYGVQCASVSLLGTSKQIRQEASGIFYPENGFELRVHASNMCNVLKWIKGLQTQQHAKHVSSLAIEFRGCEMTEESVNSICDAGYDSEEEDDDLLRIDDEQCEDLGWRLGRGIVDAGIRTKRLEVEPLEHLEIVRRLVAVVRDSTAEYLEEHGDWERDATDDNGGDG